MFNEIQKRTLLTVARQAIGDSLKGKKPVRPVAVDPVFLEKCGAFVTLEKEGELRGCIGHIAADRVLIDVIREMALQAAFHDPRFHPLQSEEVNSITIELSILSEFQRIQAPSEIHIGLHGLYIRKGFFSGLLLPQVAARYGWDRDTFLRHICIKAGLPEDAWRDDESELFVFSADVFSET
ncbi:MAG: AmmeMemoRadiSam system protein A [Candidatus Omnitrophica bacterium]|nr:AmmeMemoRadiSam system protein A [Candidatus Omnitrophota bacterium]